LKDNSISLFGEVQDEQFLKKLQKAMHNTVAAISADLNNRSGAELGVLFANFQPENADHDVYRARIGELLAKYDVEVKRLDRAEMLVEMDAYEKKRLAIIRVDECIAERYLYAWVSPELKEMVVNKWKARGKSIVENFDPGRLDGHLPNPETEIEPSRLPPSRPGFFKSRKCPYDVAPGSVRGGNIRY
jgi:hypothetical protein